MTAEREPGRERRTATTARRLRCEVPAVSPHDAPSDGQADARPGVAFSSSAAGHAVEALEHALQIGVRKTFPGVGHLDEAGSTLASAAHPQLAPGCRGCARVPR